jgi:hypothetical protein
VTLLLSGRLLVDSHVQNSMCDVLGAAAFIVGEFAEYLDEHLEVITAMLKPQVAALSFGVQNMFVHNVLKVYSSGLSQVLYIVISPLHAMRIASTVRVRCHMCACYVMLCAAI